MVIATDVLKGPTAPKYWRIIDLKDTTDPRASDSRSLRCFSSSNGEIQEFLSCQFVDAFFSKGNTIVAFTKLHCN